jgi:hypothetical protein
MFYSAGHKGFKPYARRASQHFSSSAFQLAPDQALAELLTSRPAKPGGGLRSEGLKGLSVLRSVGCRRSILRQPAVLY